MVRDEQENESDASYETDDVMEGLPETRGVARWCGWMGVLEQLLL